MRIVPFEAIELVLRFRRMLCRQNHHSGVRSCGTRGDIAGHQSAFHAGHSAGAPAQRVQGQVDTTDFHVVAIVSNVVIYYTADI